MNLRPKKNRMDLLKGNNMHKFITLFLLLTLVLIVGCGGSSEMVTTKATKEAMGNIPKWFLKPPTDSDYLFDTGTDKSRDLGMARDKAAMSARKGIATKVEVKLESLGKRFQDEVVLGDDTEIMDKYTSSMKEIVSTVLSGTNIEKQEVFKEGNFFRVYVLISYPLGAASQRMADKIKQQKALMTEFHATKAWEDLSKEVEKFEQRKKDEMNSMAP